MTGSPVRLKYPAVRRLFPYFGSWTYEKPISSFEQKQQSNSLENNNPQSLNCFCKQREKKSPKYSNAVCQSMGIVSGVRLRSVHADQTTETWCVRIIAGSDGPLFFCSSTDCVHKTVCWMHWNGLKMPPKGRKTTPLKVFKTAHELFSPFPRWFPKAVRSSISMVWTLLFLRLRACRGTTALYKERTATDSRQRALLGDARAWKGVVRRFPHQKRCSAIPLEHFFYFL